MSDELAGEKALAGRRVVVTRAATQAATLRESLAALGAEVICCPLLSIEAATAEAPALAAYQWLVVTSANGVRHLAALLGSETGSPRLPAALRVAVVGPGTAAALNAELAREPDLVADPPTGEGLAASFRARGLAAGTRVLRVRGDLAPPAVEAALRGLGAEVDPLTVYRTVTVPPAPEAQAAVTAGEVDAVTFFSPSAIHAFELAFAGHRLQARTLAACVGPVTAQAATDAGWQRVLTAPRPEIPALSAAVAAALAAGA
jgi:uroporphyrinogen-III synthase